MKKIYQNEKNTKYGDSKYLHEVIEPSLLNYNNNIIKLILGVESQKKSILEFGAGSGALAKIVRDKLKKPPICIEIDESLITLLQDDGFETYKSALDIEKKFDLIYSSNVLEHIRDDDKILFELRDKLKEEGSLVLYLPAFQFLFTELDLKVGHYRRYEKNSLVNQLKRLGFKIKKIHYADSLGFIATFLIKIFGWNTKSGLGSKVSLVIYDKFFFHISRFLDIIGFNYLFGKNIFVHVKKDK